MARRRGATYATRLKAREIPGPWFQSRVLCLRCGAEGIATYAVPPETFRCSRCDRYDVVRDEETVPADYHAMPARLQ